MLKRWRVKALCRKAAFLSVSSLSEIINLKAIHFILVCARYTGTLQNNSFHGVKVKNTYWFLEWKTFRENWIVFVMWEIVLFLPYKAWKCGLYC